MKKTTIEFIYNNSDGTQINYFIPTDVTMNEVVNHFGRFLASVSYGESLIRKYLNSDEWVLAIAKEEEE